MNSTDPKPEGIQIPPEQQTLWSIFEDDKTDHLHICRGGHGSHEPHQYVAYAPLKDEWGERSYFKIWQDTIATLRDIDPDWDSDSSISPAQAHLNWMRAMAKQAEDMNAEIEKYKATIKELDERIGDGWKPLTEALDRANPNWSRELSVSPRDAAAMLINEQCRAPEFDPKVRTALHRALVGAGWKAPEHPKK